MPTKSAPATPASAHMCSTLQAPAATAERCATAATVSRNATTTTSLSARTKRPFLPVSTPPTGRVETTNPPLGGNVAIAGHGMEMSSARGAPDTSGAVIWVTCPSAVPWGHRTVAVVCFTGSNGTVRHSSRPARLATTAINRGMRCDRSLPSWGTRLDGKGRRFVRFGRRAGPGACFPFSKSVSRFAAPGPRNKLSSQHMRSKWGPEATENIRNGPDNPGG